ncbi:MAG: hypothetical protein KKA37_13615 [Alphaproteobacteria bacterium]|nr:hypothetical protein [Alphaproteobacteria bacterium]
MVNDRGRRNLVGVLGGFGAALLFGGLFAAGTMIVVPFQVGLADLWRENALADPAFYIFVGFAILFLILAGAGAYLCLRAWRLYRDGQAGRSDR